MLQTTFGLLKTFRIQPRVPSSGRQAVDAVNQRSLALRRVLFCGFLEETSLFE